MDTQIEQLLKEINNIIGKTELNEIAVDNFVFEKLSFPKNGFAIFSKEQYESPPTKVKRLSS